MKVHAHKRGLCVPLRIPCGTPLSESPGVGQEPTARDEGQSQGGSMGCDGPRLLHGPNLISLCSTDHHF